jgi:transcriptional regulator with XRE-family HTH domain
VLRLRLIVRLRAEGWAFEAIRKRLGVSRLAVHRAMTAPPWKTAARNLASLGRRLKALRLAAGLSRRDPARQAVIDYGTVRKAEHGRCWPHPATFERLAKALGVTVAVLTGRSPCPEPQSPMATAGRDKLAIYLGMQLRRRRKGMQDLTLSPALCYASFLLRELQSNLV